MSDTAPSAVSPNTFNLVPDHVSDTDRYVQTTAHAEWVATAVYYDTAAELTAGASAWWAAIDARWPELEEATDMACSYEDALAGVQSYDRRATEIFRWSRPGGAHPTSPTATKGSCHQHQAGRIDRTLVKGSDVQIHIDGKTGRDNRLYGSADEKGYASRWTRPISP
ncbi:hypothetical protein [Nocardia sp. XZ_19_369]|uniref:hypothetical protein n=1 Tax=Nocardia sp. XZ_19_369 TaxID=2769487 RepID=UPI00188EAC44|nr:hypothetical protein [Nocardia sp. XZ_19_369]